MQFPDPDTWRPKSLPRDIVLNLLYLTAALPCSKLAHSTGTTSGQHTSATLHCTGGRSRDVETDMNQL